MGLRLQPGVASPARIRKMENRGNNASMPNRTTSYESPALVDLGTLEDLTLGNFQPIGSDVPNIGGPASA